MDFLMVPSFYAPKSPCYIEKYGSDKIHAVSYNRCNFRCSFCGFQELVRKNSYHHYSASYFKEKVLEFIKQGPGFKFTGGEPTLNPDLIPCLEIVKSAGGCVLLDTNGSNQDVVRKAVESSLVDVLGISLKGLSPQEAMNTSGISKAKLCWDNVMESICCGSQREGVDVIVTYVVTSKTDLAALDRFASLFDSMGNVYLKINNFQESEYTKHLGLTPFDSGELRTALRGMIKNRPHLCGKVIYIDGASGINDLSGIEVL